MPATLIDGTATAKAIRADVKAEVERVSAGGLRPKLVVVLVGERSDSKTYVGMKERACKECGIDSEVVRLPDTIKESDLIAKVRELNASPSVDGILVQLPLPSHINEKEVLNCVEAGKDVDGLHPFNIGSLLLKGHEPPFTPCTAEGCIELLKRYNVPLEGKDALVLGRSNIVGLPVALLLQQANCTVTIAHSRTVDLEEKCRRADIVIAAIGKAKYVKGSWLKIGATVIDVGINAIDDSSAQKGYRLVGDVDFDECKEKCAFITPVPGGVGPMTVAILMRNTLKAFSASRGASEESQQRQTASSTPNTA